MATGKTAAPQTLATMVGRALLSAFLMLVTFVLVVVVVSRFVPLSTGFTDNAAQSPAVSQAAPAAEPPALALVEEYGCWTGTAPDDVTPRHVILTLDGAEGPSRRGLRWVQRALEQVFHGADRGIAVVHAFCP